VRSDKVISSASRQYIIITLEGRDDNGVLDPTSLPVAMAFLPQDIAPGVNTVWYPGTWTTVTQPNLNPIYEAKVLIGPGVDAIPLSLGSWDVWVRIIHPVESPVVRADTILIV
jgi:hypothetical protein